MTRLPGIRRSGPRPILVRFRRRVRLALASAAAWPLACAAQPVAGGPAGFALPEPDHRFEFPRDYGAHEDFRIEWWYLTGHLHAAGSGRRFGFQATFFRIATGGPAQPADLHLAHMAVTDVTGGDFLHAERLNRAGWDAHAASGRLDLANGPWSLRQLPDGSLELLGSVEARAGFALRLRPEKPLVLFGDRGVSRKGAEPSAASYYLTFSRLDARGRLTLGETGYAVEGEAWMDHEISSSQLGAAQVGWDWTGLQLRDSPRELMLYRMRLRDGSADPASRLQWVDREGRVVTEPFAWTALGEWKSPHSGARYPAKVRLDTIDPETGRSRHFLLEPLVADQELANDIGGGPYWEGACRVRDADSGAEVGSAYLELTGYARALRI